MSQDKRKGRDIILGPPPDHHYPHGDRVTLMSSEDAKGDPVTIDLDRAEPLEPCPCGVGTVELDTIGQSAGSLANIGSLYAYRCHNCDLAGDYTDTIEEATQIWNAAVADEWRET